MDQKSSEFPNLPKELVGLGEMASNLWWSWQPEARMLFKMLDRQAWKETRHNPVKMLRELPQEVFAWATGDENYMRHFAIVFCRFKKYMTERRGYRMGEEHEPKTPTIAYFSSEYGLHHSLPFYAGGLGFLAGDYLKECSDSRVPMVAIGFMYPEGYVRQQIREDGWQENLDQILDRDAASISRVLNEEGKQLLVRVPLVDPPIYVGVWKVQVGRVPLYLMDTTIEKNDPQIREISAQLYSGDIEMRLLQEIVLGIGGSEVFNTLGVEQTVLHLNEGHPAFALLERIRRWVEGGMSYHEAVDKVRSTSVFTTHTPVPAGHDVFPFSLIEKYFTNYWASLEIDRETFLQLGAHPKDPDAGFNMTVLALRLSEFRNGVSKKHGEVTRTMWQSLWPEADEDTVPIDHVTNGIHIPTWVEPKMRLLFDKHLGPTWFEDRDNPLVWEFVEEIPDEELWRLHYWLKIKLIDTIRERSRQRWSNDHANASIVLVGGALLDPSVLTIGFARRFATYKRADLIFYDLERLKRLLNDRWRPIQIIFAGKAHPADDPGKQLIQRVVNFARNPDLGGRIAFVEDYGEQFAQYMLHGVDVWLNNPLPPLEASGTSGMKAALNGVPQLSALDGWWIEGFNGKNGWAFEHKEINGNRDQADAEAIYDILEKEVVPCYYKVSEQGVPHDWVKVMRESIRSNAAKFSARRMVKEYLQKFYAKALENAQGEGQS